MVPWGIPGAGFNLLQLSLRLTCCRIYSFHPVLCSSAEQTCLYPGIHLLISRELPETSLSSSCEGLLQAGKAALWRLGGSMEHPSAAALGSSAWQMAFAAWGKGICHMSCSESVSHGTLARLASTEQTEISRGAAAKGRLAQGSTGIHRGPQGSTGIHRDPSFFCEDLLMLTGALSVLGAVLWPFVNPGIRSSSSFQGWTCGPGTGCA